MFAQVQTLGSASDRQRVARHPGALLGPGPPISEQAELRALDAAQLVVVHDDAVDPTIRGEYTGLWSNRLAARTTLSRRRPTSALLRRLGAGHR